MKRNLAYASGVEPRGYSSEAKAQAGSMPRFHPLTLIGLFDQAILFISGTTAYNLLQASREPPPLAIFLAIAASAVFFALTAYARRLYSPVRMETVVRQFMPFAFALCQSCMGAGIVLFFAGPVAFAQEWVLSSLLLNLVFMALTRAAFWLTLTDVQRRTIFSRSAILVGGGEKAAQLLQEFADGQGNCRIQGVFLTDDQVAAPYNNTKLLRSLPELLSYCKAQGIDDIIITPELQHHPRGDEMFKALEVLPCSIKCCIEGKFFNRPMTDLELVSDQPVVTIFRMPLSGSGLVLKRMEDVVISSLLILLSAPLLVLVAGLVALDGKGQVIFRQKRHGFGGTEFEIFKFRSMKPSLSAPVIQATRDDDRFTWIGKLLRRTSIDELPQLFNVLRGDMSMVGPRPHAVAHNYYYRELINGYVARQRIKPGITGWAQINGWRGETDTLDKMHRRVEHDLYYVEHWSLWFDIKILVLTLVTFAMHKNAY